jgi:hypothetical protein
VQTQEVTTKERRSIIRPAKARGIALLTPTLGRVSSLWARRLVDIVWPMNTMRIAYHAIDHNGGEVGEMRNYLVQLMLDHEAQSRGEKEITHIFWMDDDVVPASPMVLQALLQHDAPIVSGVYFTKGEFGKPLIFDGGSAGSAKWQPSKVIESWGWSQGLSLVQFDVFKRMRDELDLGKDKYGRPAWFRQPGFSVGPEGGMLLGGTEDFVFFDNANRLGYTPIVDCTKHAFGFHIDLASLQGYPEVQFEQFVKGEPIIWPAAKGEEEVIWS